MNKLTLLWGEELHWCKIVEIGCKLANENGICEIETGCIKQNKKKKYYCLHVWSSWKNTKRGSKRKFFRRCNRCGSIQHI